MPRSRVAGLRGVAVRGFLLGAVSPAAGWYAVGSTPMPSDGGDAAGSVTAIAVGYDVSAGPAR